MDLYFSAVGVCAFLAVVAAIASDDPPSGQGDSIPNASQSGDFSADSGRQTEPEVRRGRPGGVYERGRFWAERRAGFADSNGDAYVDLIDYYDFRRCMEGTTTGEFSGECLTFDGNLDGTLDLLDFGSLQRVFTGASGTEHVIAGTIYDMRGEAGGFGVPGVTLVFRGQDTTLTVTTGGDGWYEAVVPHGWSGTAISSRQDMRLRPQPGEYQRVVLDISQDYVAAVTALVISGVILRGDGKTPAVGRPIELTFRNQAGAVLNSVITTEGKYRTALVTAPGTTELVGSVTARGPDVRFEASTRPFSIDLSRTIGPDFIAFYDVFVDAQSPTVDH